jgi:hypothetical protein
LVEKKSSWGSSYDDKGISFIAECNFKIFVRILSLSGLISSACIHSLFAAIIKVLFGVQSFGGVAETQLAMDQPGVTSKT